MALHLLCLVWTAGLTAMATAAVAAAGRLPVPAAAPWLCLLAVQAICSRLHAATMHDRQGPCPYERDHPARAGPGTGVAPLLCQGAGLGSHDLRAGHVGQDPAAWTAGAAGLPRLVPAARPHRYLARAPGLSPGPEAARCAPLAGPVQGSGERLQLGFYKGLMSGQAD